MIFSIKKNSHYDKNLDANHPNPDSYKGALLNGNESYHWRGLEIDPKGAWQTKVGKF